jgi:hypothetical protein
MVFSGNMITICMDKKLYLVWLLCIDYTNSGSSVSGWLHSRPVVLKLLCSVNPYFGKTDAMRHVKRMYEQRITKWLLEMKMSGRIPRGRPCTWCIYQVKRDIERRGGRQMKCKNGQIKAVGDSYAKVDPQDWNDLRKKKNKKITWTITFQNPYSCTNYVSEILPSCENLPCKNIFQIIFYSLTFLVWSINSAYLYVNSV